MAISITKQPKLRSSVRNSIPLEVLADNNYQDYPGYYLKLRIQRETFFTADDWTDLPIDVRGFPDISRKVTWNLSSLLKPLVGKNPPDHPESILAAAKLDNYTTARYRYIIEERQLTGELLSQNPSTTFFVYNAGFNFKRGQQMNDWIDTGLFLTNQPRVKPVTKIQPEYLYIVTPAEGNAAIKLNLYHEDDTTTTGHDPSISTYNFANNILYFAVNYNLLGLDAITPEVVKYDVYVEQGTWQSEVMTYNVIPCVDNERYYLFQNSLGGYDTVRTVGELEMNMATSGVTAERMIEDNYLRRFVQSQTQHQDTFTQAIGTLSEAENRWLRDLLRSEDAYRLGEFRPYDIHKSNDYIPIHLDRGNNRIRVDNDFLYPLTFKYTESNRNVGI